MENTAYRAVAIVGAGAVMPEAPNAAAFWNNIKSGKDCITEVTPDRWDAALYYDPDPRAPDKTYSKIGGWVREYPWDPFKWKMGIPPRVADAMDPAQKWGVACTREVLADYGYPERPLDTERTAVILGNAMAGEQHYLTSLRAFFPEYARELDDCASFAALPEAVRRDITREWHARIGGRLPPITEDSMPGELANCLAGRIANLFNFRGANFTCDAACASAMAAIRAAAEGLIEHDFDAVVTGGLDHNMGAPTFIKFCKIGALSGTGSRPYAQGADGFVMGEGAALFLMKRLEDAERDGDRIYAVIRGIGASSDGKGKGITAPNPIGQKIAVERGWQNAGLSLATATLIEGHGTSTSVGDRVEIESIAAVLKEHGINGRKVALGSVKSNIGHLKGAAGAAGIFKVAMALYEKVLPPSIHCEHPNTSVDFDHLPLTVNTELRPWTEVSDGVRRAGASAFGFGGTNFHVVMEEYVPHRITGGGKQSSVTVPAPPPEAATPSKPPLRGALVIGAASQSGLVDRLRTVHKAAAGGHAPAPARPAETDLRSPYRLAIDYGDAAELAAKCAKALKAFEADQPAMWKALQAQGVFRGKGPAPKVAFLYTGQGSQYVNMLRPLCERDPIVAETFAEADRVMTPLLGKPLTEFIFVDKADPAATAKAEADLMQTAITQPAVITSDIALTRLLASYGIVPDMTMGHSVGEYGALTASGALSFPEALEAVSARGREMTRVSFEDNGRMVAVMAPIDEIERILKTVDGYVVIANVNSRHQAVVGGASKAIEQAMAAFQKAGYEVVPLPVSHAFHTSVVAPASEPLVRMLQRLHFQPPRIPIIANINGEFYPTGPDTVQRIYDILGRQIASPVQFVKGLETLYDAGGRVFVETGPKKALYGFAEDVLGPKGDVLALFANHPKTGDVVSFNQALCGLYAAGLGAAEKPAFENERVPATPLAKPVVITGAALGLPGNHHIFDDGNLERILRGEQCIDLIPTRFRQAILDKHITRLVKTDNGGPSFEAINDPSDVLKLAGRGSAFDLTAEYGISAERVAAMDRATCLAIAVGIDALRDAGIPLVMRYKNTTKGTQLPDRWTLPDSLRDDTGVIFASVFPGYDSFADDMSRYFADHSRREQLAALESLRKRFMDGAAANTGAIAELDRRIAEIRTAIEKSPYVFDRRFIFRILSMGHSQFAELIGARGPNTQINSACASTAEALAVAEDWIANGRCRRVIIVSADDITSDHLIEWFGAAFLASGAAATDDIVENAAVPFDRRRHGMIIGMGAAALVVESADAAAERGLRPICEVVSAIAANSAFHGTRLDPAHIAGVMEKLVIKAEERGGVPRDQLAANMVFVSHETYTPARGGSASAEIHALHTVFKDAADRIVIANTKGFTGHAMGAGIEEVVAVKSLETGWVPPVANFREPDPELGPLNLSHGGAYPVEYALRLGAGFGSQISMTLMRRVAANGARPAPSELGYEYRIADRDAWKNWLEAAAGGPVDLEVVNRTLRIHDARQVGGAPAIATAPAPAPVIEAPAPEPAPLPEPVKLATPPETKPVQGNARQAEYARATNAREAVLAIVAEKTGYPPEMLALDLDLEADLGIDTVKQAEMFAAVRAAFGIERDPNLKLRDFPTLAHVIQYAEARGGGVERPADTPSARAVAAPSAPASAEPPAAAQPIAEAPPRTTDVRQTVLAIVAEKTGYPVDMLDPDLDLEADLGIDTVKQAEMFASVRAAFGIERDPNLKLRDFPTLGHVIRFAEERSAPPKQEPAQAKQEPAQAKQEPAQANARQAEDACATIVLAIVAEKTGYPVEMLDPDLDLEADLGIDTVKQAEMFASVRAAFGIERDPNLKLRDFPTLGHVIRFAEERGAAPKEAPAQAKQEPAQAKQEPSQAKQEPAQAKQEPAQAKQEPSQAKQEPAQANARQAEDACATIVLAIVAEKTGYPVEMLDPDLDLEADLGIDTVKQAEMFASVRAAFGIERDPNLKLRDFPTLGHVIRFAEERSAVPKQAPAPAKQESAQAKQEPAPVKQEPAQANARQAEDARATIVLAIVAEKTGYPVEMLDPDLDLEADLGIDTVKQAEMFASVRAAFGIERDPNLKLRDFPTLGHVIRFAEERGGSPRQETAQASARQAEDACATIPRRVPAPVLRPPLTLAKDTGVSLSPARRVLVVADRGGVGDTLAARLRSLGVEVLTAPDSGPLHGVYWLPALDREPDLAALDLASWREALRVRVKSLYTLMRERYTQIATPDTFLISATRMGGLHGYENDGASAPLGGAVTGFTKAYKRERADTLVKAVDFEAGATPAAIAELLIEETLRDPAAIEIGYRDGQRWTIGLEEQAVQDGHPGLVLNKDSVFLITGAAGSIVSAITVDLAAASGGTFHLLDLIPEPDPESPDLKRFATDKDGLKRELFNRLQARGERATPVTVERELAAIERAKAAADAIAAVRSAGGTAYYYSVNLTDADAVAKVIEEVRRNSGRIDVLLHAAGIERSHFLPDKDPREFDLVFDVKADGWFNLMHAIGEMPVGATVAFSSVAGRFGNAGQTDYSAANDLLCKIASNFRTTRPATRAISIDWTAWAGIGMASRGSIPKMMEMAGIDMLPPEAGVPWIRRELTAGGRRGEVVVASRLGVLTKELDEAGGVNRNAPLPGPMMGRLEKMDSEGRVTIETVLDPTLQPFLRDHCIDGTPVLPGVMGIEAFAEAARAIAPGWYIDAIENVAFLAPFKYYRNEPRPLTVEATFRPEGAALVAECRLIGRRTLPHQAEPQVTTHFTARVRLTKTPPPAPSRARIPEQSGSLVEAAGVYRVYFHGPAYQVIRRAWCREDSVVAEMPAAMPANHYPESEPLAMAPRLIELCFQTAGLWEMVTQHRMGLPWQVDRVRVYGAEAPRAPVFALITPASSGDAFHGEVVDRDGNRYLELSGYRTIAFRENVDSALLKAVEAVSA